MSTPSPRTGDHVYFMSGRYLGKVEAVRDRAFRVVSDQDAQWLETRVVFTVERGRVTLICEADGLGNYLAND